MKELEPNKTKGETVKVPCKKCQRTTNHSVEQSLDRSIHNNHDGTYWSIHYQIIRCLGCDEYSFRKEFYSREDEGHPIGPDEWSDGRTVTLYPERSKDTRKPVNFGNLIPRKMRMIYLETIQCFNGKNLILCAAGLRSIIEGLCADKQISDGPVTSSNGSTQRRNNLEGKISGLSEAGLLTEAQANTLHEHRYLGNLAVHEIVRPPLNELNIAIEIVEHVINTIYVIPNKGSALSASRQG